MRLSAATELQPIWQVPYFSVNVAIGGYNGYRLTPRWYTLVLTDSTLLVHTPYWYTLISTDSTLVHNCLNILHTGTH